MKTCKYIFIIFLTGLIGAGNVHAYPKPKPKSKTSCTVFRGKFTVSDQIEYKYGIVAGRNVGTIKSEQGASQDVISGLTGGLAFQVVYPKGFMIQPELLYSQKGCLFGGNGVIKYHVDYLEMPVKAIYRLHVAEVKPFAFVAPYGAYVIRIAEDGEVSKDDYLKDRINKWDFGIGAGAGFDVWKIQVSFRYSWGLTLVANETYPIRNKVFTVAAGFFF